MNKIFLILSVAAFAVGCSSYYPPRTSMYSDYGFTYDYKESPVPSATDVPVSSPSTTAPTFLVQVPPPTVIYQSAPSPSTSVQSSAETAPAAEANPYKGSYLIPPKVVVVPQQTIIRESAGAATGIVSNAPVQPQPTPNTYIYPGVIGTGIVDTNTPGTNTNSNVVVTNTFTNRTLSSVTNTINEGAGAQPTNNTRPFTPLPTVTNTVTPPVGTQPGSSLQRPNNTQATTGSGTGQGAQTTTGGSFAPPPPGTTPLPGTQPRQ